MFWGEHAPSTDLTCKKVLESVDEWTDRQLDGRTPRGMNEELNRQERMEIEGLEQDERTPVEMPTQDVPANSFLAMGDTRDD